MNRERLAGICLQLGGTMKMAWGELSGDPFLAAAGKRSRLLGKARQACASEQEQAARQLRDFQDRHRNWHFQTSAKKAE